jgi:hypothetical protein
MLRRGGWGYLGMRRDTLWSSVSTPTSLIALRPPVQTVTIARHGPRAALIYPIRRCPTRPKFRTPHRLCLVLFPVRTSTARPVSLGMTHGTQGTPALNIISLLSLLLPILLIASSGGPIKTIPASVTCLAKIVDSDMNPYPG